jgi:hypothetical protein
MMAGAFTKVIGKAIAGGCATIIVGIAEGIETTTTMITTTTGDNCPKHDSISTTFFLAQGVY